MPERSLAYLDPINFNENQQLRLAILGASGSIGQQALDIVHAHPNRFSITALSVHTNIEAAVKACHEFHPRVVAITDPTAGNASIGRIKDVSPQTEVIIGNDRMCELVTRHDVDIVLTATVGYSGLLPTVEAIKAGKDIALANKETLVVAGEYIRRLMNDSKTRIFPVDSEHSAIAQCLRGEDLDTVRRLIITASGGPFRNFSVESLKHVTAKDALRHPNWNMGAKITIDSATMMNKAFEIIEAFYLFGIPADRISPVVHPQSIVHSMVEFTDGAVKAQLGVPDMHLPIAYALGLNNRASGVSMPLTLTDIAELTFERPDVSKFPCLDFAGVALERRGNTACIINAANEIAVSAFLNGKIAFNDIYKIIEKTLIKIEYIKEPLLQDYIETNAVSRQYASALI